MKKLAEEIKKLLNLYKLKKLPEAETAASDLINKHPQNVWLYNILGLILTEQKRFDEAINFYEKGIEVDANYAEIYNNLATIYKEKKAASLKDFWAVSFL